MNTQGEQTAARRADTRASQQALRDLTTRRAQVARALTTRQEQDFEAKSRFYERRLFVVGIKDTHVEVAHIENQRRYATIQTHLDSLGPNPLG